MRGSGAAAQASNQAGNHGQSEKERAVQLEGKVAVVTGSGQGIGFAIARRFLSEGASVVVADVSSDRGERAAAELKSLGDVEFVSVDISDEESVQEMVRAAEQRFGAIDILVNNAALYFDLDMSDNSPAYFRRVMDVNFFGTWLCSRAVAPGMVARNAGRIINMSSDAAYLYNLGATGEFVELGSFAYHISKLGVIGITKFTAGQLAPHGVCVNAIAPGVTMTEATKKVVPGELIAMLTAATPMRSTLEPQDLAGAAVFLASEDARYVTGQVLCVDGGMQMPA